MSFFQAQPKQPGSGAAPGSAAKTPCAADASMGAGGAGATSPGASKLGAGSSGGPASQVASQAASQGVSQQGGGQVAGPATARRDRGYSELFLKPAKGPELRR